MGGWVNPHSRYGIQFRYHNAELMAQHHRDYAIGSIASYVYHGSDCPIIHGLKTRYNSLVRQKTVFLPQSVHSFIRVCVIILQRQSRDKHRETCFKHKAVDCMQATDKRCAAGGQDLFSPSLCWERYRGERQSKQYAGESSANAAKQRSQEKPVRKAHLLRHFVLKTISFLRQARDKHRGKTPKERSVFRVFRVFRRPRRSSWR